MGVFNCIKELLFPVEMKQKRAEIDAAVIRYVENTAKCNIFHKAISSREQLNSLKHDIKFLERVVGGRVNRQYIKAGLCLRMNNTMAKTEFLRDYKYWSGGLAFAIRVPVIKGDAKDQYLFEKECRFSESQVMYYQARQELAQHWLNILKPIYDDARLCRSA